MRGSVVWMGIASTALVMAACGDDGSGSGGRGGGTSTSTSTSTSTGTGTSSGGSGGAGGAGGAPDLDKDPATVTDADECYYEGDGGANGWGCSAAVIELSAPIPRDELTISITASDGTVFDGFVASDDPGDEIPETPTFFADEPATALFLRYEPDGVEGNEHYAPQWLDVEVRRSGVVVGAERFEPLDYTCYALRSDDWCWESAPVTIAVNDPE